MKTIRAKFKCTQVTKTEDWRKKQDFLYNAELQPVTSGSEENEEFYAATPGGGISLCSIVSDQFVPGKEYYVEFTAVEA